MKMKLLIFAGSNREQSYTRKLAKIAADMGLVQGAEVSILDLSTLDIPIYNADVEAKGTPGDVVVLKKIMDQHEAWIIVTPEYNGSYSGLLKNALDWASSPIKDDPIWSDWDKPFRNKVVGLMSASPGALGGLRSLLHLQELLFGLGCWTCPKHYGLAKAHEAFTPENQLESASAQEQVLAVVTQTLWVSKRFNFNTEITS
jgi:chromate reductase, NAD(P)H dehydrogenase (quinone)